MFDPGGVSVDEPGGGEMSLELPRGGVFVVSDGGSSVVPGRGESDVFGRLVVSDGGGGMLVVPVGGRSVLSDGGGGTLLDSEGGMSLKLEEEGKFVVPVGAGGTPVEPVGGASVNEADEGTSVDPGGEPLVSGGEGMLVVSEGIPVLGSGGNEETVLVVAGGGGRSLPLDPGMSLVPGGRGPFVESPEGTTVLSLVAGPLLVSGGVGALLDSGGSSLL